MNLKQYFSLAKEKGLDIVQITQETIHSSEVKLINFTLERLNSHLLTEYIIKASQGGNVVKIRTNILDEESIDLLLYKLSAVESYYEDSFVEPVTEEDQSLKLNLSLKEDIAFFKNLQKELVFPPSFSLLEIQYQVEHIKKTIANSEGTHLKTENILYSFYTEATMKQKEKTGNFSQYKITAKKDEIHFKEIIEEVLEKAQLRLIETPLATKSYPLIIAGDVVAKLLGKMVPMFSKTLIRQKESCMEGKLGKAIFGSNITLLELPQEKKYPGYSLFDSEGTLTKNKTVVENGVLKTFLYDNKEANLENRKEAGNCYAAIGVRNFYLKPGSYSLEQLLKKMQNGLYITSYMASSSTGVRTSSGDISIQLMGYLVENGVIKNAFKPCVLTTTIFYLFSKVEAISNEITFACISTAAPAILVKDTYITGEIN